MDKLFTIHPNGSITAPDNLIYYRGDYAYTIYENAIHRADLDRRGVVLHASWEEVHEISLDNEEGWEIHDAVHSLFERVASTPEFKVALLNTSGMEPTTKKHFEYYLSIGLRIRKSIDDLKSFFFVHSLEVDFDSNDKVVVYRSQKDHTPILVIQPAV